jgi:hypothetical protein
VFASKSVAFMRKERREAKKGRSEVMGWVTVIINSHTSSFLSIMADRVGLISLSPSSSL